jgi:hypothetical protein
MRLVDDEQRRLRGGQLLEGLLVRELLGREEQELEPALLEALARRSPAGRPELSAAASSIASTWSSWSAISGETTMVAPSVSSPATW